MGVATDVALCQVRWDQNCASNKAQKLCKSIYPFAQLMNHTCQCLQAPRDRGMFSGRKIILTEVSICNTVGRISASSSTSSFVMY